MSKKGFWVCLCAAVTVIVALWVSGDGNAATLTVRKDGTGNGTVTSTPTGVNCGADCTEAYSQGKKVTLKAKADSDSTFTGWTGGGCSGSGNCAVIMNSDVTVNSTFTAKTVDFGVSAEEIDFGELDVGSKVTRTLTITNMGTADIQVEISGLDGTEFSISGKNIVTIKPKKSYNLKVTFKPTDTGSDEALQQADSTVVESEDLKDPDSGAGAKIIIVQREANIRASNKNQTQTKSRTVTLKGGKKAQAKEYELEVNNEFKFMDGGSTNGFTYTEEGRIPFEIVQDHVHCYDLTGQYEIPCIGGTKLTIKGKFTGSKGVCTWEGTGTVMYELTGGVANEIFYPNIKMIEFGGGINECCQTDTGTKCAPIPGFGSYLDWYINSLFQPTIPFKDKGNVHLTPSIPGFTSASLWWTLIFP